MKTSYNFRLASLMRKAGLNQIKLAEATHIHFVTISNIMNKKNRRATKGQKFVLAQFFGKPEEYIFGKDRPVKAGKRKQADRRARKHFSVAQ